MLGLQEFLHSKGFDYTPVLDGSFERFSIGEKENVGWLIGNGHYVTFGNWATGEKHSWEDTESKSKMSPEELAEFEQAQAEQREKLAQEKENRRAEAKELAQKIWNLSKTATALHPYLKKKKASAYGLRVSSKTGQLIIPVYNNKEIVSLQFIDDSGTKKFLPGGRLSGSYFSIGHQSGCPNRIYLCEGYSTGASILECAPEKSLVIITFNSGNLPKVAEILANNSQLKECPVIICADNDQLTPGNPGISAAEHAQSLLPGSIILTPPFSSEEAVTKLTDFNDWYSAHGKESLVSILAGGQQEPRTPPPTPPKTLPGASLTRRLIDRPIRPLEWRRDKKGSLVRPSQNQVGEALCDLYGDSLMRERREVFEWVGTHWVELEPVNFKHFIRAGGQVLLGGTATDKDLNAYFNIFMDKLECIPAGMSFYTQLPNISNFQDGTLRIAHSKETGGSKKSLEFTEHRRTDFCTWALPYKYKAPRPKSQVLEEWLEKTFKGDQEKLRALAQIGGACLIPVHPRLVFFHGPAGTGKSTFAKLCAKFIGPENHAECPPEDMHGFMMESLIGKRVNIVTDISGGRVDKGIFKRIQDNTGILVNRKGRLAVRATIPSLHLFCGNSLPKGIDGETDAMDRRVTIIEMDSTMKEEEMRFGFEEEILAEGQGALLDFFEKGLLDLIQSGMFFNPKSGRNALKEWKKENNPIEQFLEDLERKEIEGIRLKEDGKIKQLDLWESFQRWNSKNHFCGKNHFYKKVRERFVSTVLDGYPFFQGIAVVGQGIGKM